MKDFQEIDWKRFNKPPFYQQWMCRDDTLKLATIGDKGLAEVDKHILSLKDQWDLDNVSCHFLDRIGKLLSEPRNGVNDDHYRIILNLRKLLNTNAGSIPAIIKAIKYLYSSEVVHIVPNFPAGLIIEHEGEGTPGLNFNRLLEEIIPAGVSFSTKELFLYHDDFPSDDEFVIVRINKDLIDSFSHTGIKFNGEIKHNGTHKAGGGIFDRFAILLKPENFVDIFETSLRHTGMIRADGSHKFDGTGGRVSDSTVRMKGKLKFKENIIIDEKFTISINQQTGYKDYFPTSYRFDGTFTHNGQIKASGSRDDLRITVKGLNTSDKHKTVLRHKGVIKADGSHKFNAETGMGDALSVSNVYKYQDSVNTADGYMANLKMKWDDTAEAQEQSDIKIPMDLKENIEAVEEFTVGLKHHHKHDGKLKANGKNNFNSGILVPV